MTRVLCHATVGDYMLSARGRLVTVTGKPPHDQTRVYLIPEVDDNVAAREGLRKFVEEMEALSE